MTVATVINTLHAAGATLDIQGDSLLVGAHTESMTPEIRQAITENKAAIIQAITGERHWTHPQTGQAFITRLARCNRCGLACWGSKAGEPETWICLVCTSNEVL